MAQVVLYDLRPESATHRQTNVVIMGERAPTLLAIPIGVAHGYRVLGTRPAGLLYHTTEAYDPADPDEERIPWDDPTIGFDWTTRVRSDLLDEGIVYTLVSVASLKLLL